MKISFISNTISSLTCKNKYISNNNKIQNKKPSFKGVYVEDCVYIGDECEEGYPPVFTQKDSLLLNSIAEQYPNQDCFIRKGYKNKPRLEYREKPPQVQIFKETPTKEYGIYIEPEDRDYPPEPLLLYGDSPLNKFFGVTTNMSINPSLPYTIKVGFELHKKLLEKKYQIMDFVGKTDFVDLGEDSVIKKAHKAIEEVETAVTRYLLEYSYASLTNKISSRQIYNGNFIRIQRGLSAMREYDLVTSIAKRPDIDPEELNKSKVDICEEAMQNYPNLEENKKRITELKEYMLTNKIFL